MREPVIVDVVRTAFGKRGGALANWHPADLLAFALTTLVERTGVNRLEPDRGQLLRARQAFLVGELLQAKPNRGGMTPTIVKASPFR